MKGIVEITLIITIQISLTRTLDNIHHVNRNSSQIDDEKLSSPMKDNYLNIEKNLFDKIRNSATIIRKSRDASPNDSLAQNINSIKRQIDNLTESIRNEDNIQSNFSRPNSNSKVAKLESEINKLKEDVEKLKKTRYTDSNSNNAKFTSLEKSLETLQKLFDEKKEESSYRIENMKSSTVNLTKSLDDFGRELEQMMQRVNNKKEES